MTLFELSLPDLFRIDQLDQTRLLQRLISLFSSNLGDCRLITAIAPLSFDTLIRKRRRLATERDHVWERRGLLEEADLIERMGNSGMQRARHYLLDFNHSTSVSQLEQWRIKAKAVPTIPLLPKGDYAEADDHFRPILNDGGLDHSRHHYCIMQSSQLNRRLLSRH